MTPQLIVSLIIGIASPIATLMVAMAKLGSEQRKLKKDIDDQQSQVIVLSLRTNIQGIYAMYRQNEQIPIVVYQGACDMYDRYKTKGGNSYVHDLMNQMGRWKKI